MKLKICGKTFRVVEQVLDQLGSDNDGVVDWNNGQIVVRNSLMPDRKRSVIAHEIAHILISDSGISEYIKPEKSEELIVCILEPHLCSFLEDNTNFYTKKND